MNENMTISNFSGWGIVIFFIIIIAAFAWFVRGDRDRYPIYGCNTVSNCQVERQIGRAHV